MAIFGGVIRDRYRFVHLRFIRIGIANFLQDFCPWAIPIDMTAIAKPGDPFQGIIGQNTRHNQRIQNQLPPGTINIVRGPASISKPPILARSPHGHRSVRIEIAQGSQAVFILDLLLLRRRTLCRINPDVISRE